MKLLAPIDESGDAINRDYLDKKEPAFVLASNATAVNNSTTLVSNGSIVLALETNGIYIVEACLFYTAYSGADLKVNFTAPSGATLNFGCHAIQSAATTSTVNTTEFKQCQMQSTAVDGVCGGVSSAATSGTVTASAAYLEGVLAGTYTAGNLTLVWAQNTAQTVDTILLKGSYLKLTKV